MAFMCPGDEEKKLATLDAIAGIVKELQQEYASSDHPSCCKCPQETASDPPAAMICCKVPKAKVGGGTGKNNRSNNASSESTVIRLKQSKSRELRASIMYVGCDCEKRNGLQDDCQRTECHGSPECLTRPYPTCGPSEFCNGKHLGRPYPEIGKNTASGASYGNTAQNTKADNAIDSLEYEYQCFPIDGLDVPCCEENP